MNNMDMNDIDMDMDEKNTTKIPGKIQTSPDGQSPADSTDSSRDSSRDSSQDNYPTQNAPGSSGR